jgi:hypothetical protein
LLVLAYSRGGAGSDGLNAGLKLVRRHHWNGSQVC